MRNVTVRRRLCGLRPPAGLGSLAARSAGVSSLASGDRG